jgi:hypothetical protein
LVFFKSNEVISIMTIKKGPKMFKKFLFPMAVIVSVSLSQASFAAD